MFNVFVMTCNQIMIYSLVEFRASLKLQMTQLVSGLLDSGGLCLLIVSVIIWGLSGTHTDQCVDKIFTYPLAYVSVCVPSSYSVTQYVNIQVISIHNIQLTVPYLSAE